MRLHLLAAWGVAACSVPDKQAIEPDAGVDAAVPPDEEGAPNTMITDAPAEFSPIAAATFRFTSDIATATFVCTIDGETPLIVFFNEASSLVQHSQRLHHKERVTPTFHNQFLCQRRLKAAAHHVLSYLRHIASA